MKILSTYYVEITDAQGAVIGIDGPLASVTRRYAIDIYSNGVHVPMQAMMAYPMVADIMNAPRKSSGTYGTFNWSKH